MTFNLDQGEFNFDSDNGEAGYTQWQKELEQQKQAIESKWNIVLGHKVRVKLREYAKPFERFLIVISEKPTGNKPPQLQIGHMKFSALDIENIVKC